MANAIATQCPDCGAHLMPIKLVVRANDGSDGAVVRYTTPESKRGTFVARYDVMGRVSAEMCESCHRIFLYGHPGNE